MEGALHTMSTQELSRLEIIQKVEAKLLKRNQAARQLGVSTRHVIRLVKAYRIHGPPGLISKRRGKLSNRRHGETFKQEVMKHVRSHYFDFGPTLASEKLSERHHLQINKETLRQWMIEAGIWKGKQRKTGTVHQQRTRRPCLGELVQIDGSPHDWFEGRAAECCLLVFIDDATSQLMRLHFVESETTLGYFEATRDYIKRCGRPLAFYNDKNSIFRVNTPEAKSGTGETQFSRAMRELGIEIICANTPQAKGRVEKANRTLQDRLIKELRLNDINDIKSANIFAAAFMTDYNKRFAVEPINATNVHRSSIPSEETLDLIFTFQYDRTLSKNLEVSYENVLYQIKTPGKGYGLRHAKVRVCDDQHGHVTLLHKGRMLPYKTLDKNNRPGRVSDAKGINLLMDQQVRKGSGAHKPKANHPWRRYGQVANREPQQTALGFL